MIVWLASYPRSGNRFFRNELLWRTFGFRVASIYPKKKEVEGEDMLPQLSVEELARSDERWFVQTHDLPRADTWPVLYLLRDGRDALVSYTHFIQDHVLNRTGPVPPEEFHKAMHDLIVGESPFGTWSQNAEAWSARAGHGVIRFERLIQSPMDEAKAALRNLDISWDEAKLISPPPSFDELHRKRPRLYRSGRVGAWRTEMPADLQQLFWEHHGPTALKMGYDP